MPQIEVLSEKPVNLSELKDKLEEIKKRDKELTFRANKVKEYLDVFAKLKSKEFSELKTKIEALQIPRLKDKHIIKILDIMPKDLDSLKTVLSAENLAIKPEELKRILECLV
jgi:DNA-directed RNA polymerase subunit F